MNMYALHASTAVPRISKAFRIQFSLLLLLCGWALAAFAAPVVPPSSSWALAGDMTGWMLFILGATIRFWSICCIAGRKSLLIVETGPYALCRNPLYIGTFMIVASEAAFLKSMWFALSLVLLIAFYHQFVIPSEECKLRTRLGADFDRYAARVPRWLPRTLNGRCLAPITIRDRSAVISELSCLACWAIVPILGSVTCSLRMLPWWPHYVPGF